MDKFVKNRFGNPDWTGVDLGIIFARLPTAQLKLCFNRIEDLGASQPVCLEYFEPLIAIGNLARNRVIPYQVVWVI